VPDRNFRDFKLFLVDLERHNCPARCVSATKAISKCSDVFKERSVLIND
jgi:hypothetical protein